MKDDSSVDEATEFWGEALGLAAAVAAEAALVVTRPTVAGVRVAREEEFLTHVFTLRKIVSMLARIGKMPAPKSLKRPSIGA